MCGMEKKGSQNCDTKGSERMAVCYVGADAVEGPQELMAEEQTRAGGEGVAFYLG